MEKEKLVFIKGKEKCNLDEINNELKDGFYQITQIIPQHVSASANNNKDLFGGFIVHLKRK